MSVAKMLMKRPNIRAILIIVTTFWMAPARAAVPLVRFELLQRRVKGIDTARLAAILCRLADVLSVK